MVGNQRKNRALAASIHQKPAVKAEPIATANIAPEYPVFSPVLDVDLRRPVADPRGSLRVGVILDLEDQLEVRAARVADA